MLHTVDEGIQVRAQLPVGHDRDVELVRVRQGADPAERASVGAIEDVPPGTSKRTMWMPSCIVFPASLSVRRIERERYRSTPDCLACSTSLACSRCATSARKP